MMRLDQREWKSCFNEWFPNIINTFISATEDPLEIVVFQLPASVKE